MYKNILVPVVLDHSHDTNASFLCASALADDDATFTVLHVMEALPAYAEYQIPADVLARSNDEIRKELSRLASGLPGANAVLVSGHAGRSILDYADEHDIDCIIVASHTPGLMDYLIGSTADRVVRHANSAVHVIR